MRLDSYDAAVALVVDHRYPESWERVVNVLKGRVNWLECYLDGGGQRFPPYFYDQTTLALPPGWQWGQGGYQHFCGIQGIVRRAKTQGWRSVLIVEDDVVLTDDFEGVVAAAHEQIHENNLIDDLDILYYGANHSDADTFDASENIMRVYGSLTTHCFGVFESAYDAILGLLPYHMIDKLMADQLHPRLGCYALWPSVAEQLPGQSTIWGIPVDYRSLFTCQGKNRTP